MLEQGVVTDDIIVRVEFKLKSKREGTMTKDHLRARTRSHHGCDAQLQHGGDSRLLERWTRVWSAQIALRGFPAVDVHLRGGDLMLGVLADGGDPVDDALGHDVLGGDAPTDVHVDDVSEFGYHSRSSLSQCRALSREFDSQDLI